MFTKRKNFYSIMIEKKMKKDIILLFFVVFSTLLACEKKSDYDLNKKRTFPTAVQNKNEATKETFVLSRIIELQADRMNGPDIVKLQTHLKQNYGFDEIGEIDGYYGPLTEAVIKTIQYYSGFEPNGKVDKQLWDFLFKQSNAVILERISQGTITAPESDFETDGNGTITVYKGQDTLLVIPRSIGGVLVTAIGDYVFSDKGLEKVIIPDSVTSIGGSAFSSNRFSSIAIGANVALGLFPFSNRPPFDSAFEDFYNVNGKKAGTYIVTDNGVSLNGETFRAYDKTEKGFTIDGLGTIIDYKGNDTSLVIPVSIGGILVKTIGTNVFSQSKFTSATIPNNVTSIYSYAFLGNQLTSITIGSNVTLRITGGDTVYDPPSFNEAFDNLYYANGQKGGTYKHSNGYWSINRGDTVIISEETENGVFVIDENGVLLDFATIRVTYEGDIIIPARLGDVLITTIKTGAFTIPMGNLSFSIPNNITSIDGGAFSFSNYSWMTSIIIGANVELSGGRYPSFRNSYISSNEFDNFYIANGKKAGTYVYNDGQWSMK